MLLSALKSWTVPKWLPKIAIIFFINLILIGLAIFIFEKKYDGRIYPGIYMGSYKMGGMSFGDAEKIISEKIDKIYLNGIDFRYGDRNIAVKPVISSEKGDFAYEIITINTEDALYTAKNYGRDNNFLVNLKNVISAFLFSRRIPLAVKINGEEVKKILAGEFSKLETPAQDAKLIYQEEKVGGKNLGKFIISKEKSGKTINYENGIIVLKINLEQLKTPAITLSSEFSYPKVNERDCKAMESRANSLLEKAPITLRASSTSDKDIWQIGKKEIASWIVIQNSDENDQNNNISIASNREEIKKFLKEAVAKDIDKEPHDAKFQIINGVMAQFQSPRDGQVLDIEASAAVIDSELFQKNQNDIILVVKELKTAISAEDVNNLGIKEIIGTGQSSFAGSPSNRRINIKVGASAVNGALIKPGEEFSLLKTLGRIDETSGYLPELVIKDNKTTPEFGGGLCQIGTTMFRAALASGLPITVRRNHSYRVAYYEPAGTDATIYDPWPDFRFINDTANHIIIQSRIKGNNLYFDFWGTRDGRISERTKPVISNIVKPKPAKIIETLDLPPGQKKCTEKAHNGADAYFDYKVIYANGDVKEKRFNSHYVPWQEVCLLGVKEISKPSVEEINTSSSTPVLIEATTSTNKIINTGTTTEN